MSKKYVFCLIVCLTIAGFSACDLGEISEGEFCQNNAEGWFAPDEFSEPQKNSLISNKIIETESCPFSNPYCNDDICLTCKPGSIYTNYKVDSDDKSTSDGQSCIECSNFDNCKASDSDCIALYNRCHHIDSCKNKGEIFDKTAYLCLCDSQNHWLGDPGQCECADGYSPVDGKCKKIKLVSCKDKGTTLDTDSNTCICDTDNHWTGEPNNCSCEKGFSESEDKCIPIPEDPCPNKGEILNSDSNTCICNRNGNWTGEPGSCA